MASSIASPQFEYQVKHLVEVQRVNKYYHLLGETIHALKELNLSFDPGEFVAVMGPSGSGKSTLLHLLGLLDEVDSGELSIAGLKIQELSDDERTRFRRDHIGFIFQNFELIPTLSAAENILLPAEVAGADRARQAEFRLKELSRVLGIEGRLQHKPSQLSGGQQQRVAIARALINKPQIILADEPTGNLDSESGRQVLELLQHRHDPTSTVIMVTHDPQAALYADRIIFLQDGELCGEVKADEADRLSRIQSFLRL
ncbi:MAG: ABC transporter ATP-binding protein [Deinococcales bacterium]